MRAVSKIAALFLVCSMAHGGAAAAAAPERQYPRPLSINPLYAEGFVSYQLRCASCHGEAGDGRGAASRFLLPRPRDFTTGVYKLRSTPPGTLPLSTDLARTIREGVPGTGMPPWCAGLSESEVRSLVRHLESLSPRFAREAHGTPVAISEPPPLDVWRMRRGRELYRKLDCARCHGDAGRGDGPSATGLEHEDGSPIRPRDFAAQPFKGGRDAVAIHRSLATGLDGTPMRAVDVPADDRWSLTFYLMSLAAGEVEP